MKGSKKGNTIPLGSVLATIMFWINVNDMTEGASGYISLFTDDREITKEDKKNHRDCKKLHNDINKIHLGPA